MFVEVVYGHMTVFLAPTPAFDIDFAHSYRHLRGYQIRYRDGLDGFRKWIAHGKDHKFNPDKDNCVFVKSP